MSIQLATKRVAALRIVTVVDTLVYILFSGVSFFLPWSLRLGVARSQDKTATAVYSYRLRSIVYREYLSGRDQLLMSELAMLMVWAF